jgi:WXXGXW repeat (2 copies)
MRENKFKKTIQPEKRRIGRRAIVGCLVGALLLGLAMIAAPTRSFARVSVGVFVNFGPPALPVYEQPPCPGAGYIWTPGYWAYDPAYGYYWVPGTWVPAPFIGAMWTPGYWNYNDGGYRWRPGYWGFSVGYYGGVNYGFGYTSFGYFGGYWNHDRFYYNRAMNNVRNTYITNVYYRNVGDRYRDRRISYHGGPGGIDVRPTREQMAAERGRRSGPVNQQMQQERFARNDRSQRASFNHGRPGLAATSRPGEFRNFARENRAGGSYHAPVERTGGRNFARPVQGRPGNQRGFQSFSGNRSGQANWRSQNRAPMQQRAEQQRYRNNSRPTQQSRQYQARPQQVRRNEGRPAPEQRSGNSPRQEGHGGGHGNGRGGWR